jgi:hypothetical protein
LDSLEFVPDVGLVVAVAGGIYMTVDWVVHHPQEAHYILDHPRVAAGRRLRALVSEVLTERPAGLRDRPTLGTIVRYTLMTPERTARMITSWARLIPKDKQRNGPPTVTLIAHDGRAALNQERFEIRPGHGTFTVTRNDYGTDVAPAVTLNETETITELTSALTRMAR